MTAKPTDGMPELPAPGILPSIHDRQPRNGVGYTADQMHQYARDYAAGLERSRDAELAGWGIIEIAVRNASVSEYMNHWEGRTLAAEADAERYRWLRESFVFANDSVWEIWFNAGVITRKEHSELLDSTIDSAIAAGRDK